MSYNSLSYLLKGGPPGFLLKGGPPGSLLKGSPTGSLLKGRHALCLRVPNVIKKERGGKKKYTVKRLTPKQYKDLKLRKIGPVKRLTSNEIQTLKRTSEFAFFDIRKRPNNGCAQCGCISCEC